LRRCHLNISGELRDGHRARAVGVERPRLLLVSSEQINRRAVEAYRQVLAEALKQGALDRDPAQVRQVNARPALDLAPMLLDLTLSLPYSRTREAEADRVGVELAACAGYDPRAAIALREKMRKLGGSRPPKFLSTPPSPEDRFKDLRIYARKLMPLYPDAKRG